MAIFVTNISGIGPTPVDINPPFPKPMTQAMILAFNTSGGQVQVLVGGQTLLASEGIVVRLETPGPFQLVGTGTEDVYVVCTQSDNYQLTGRLVEYEFIATGGGGGGTYGADGVTLQLVGTTFSVRNGGINTTQLANDAVTADKIAAAVAGAGLSGGAGTALAVNVDNVGIEIAVDNLQLKDLGVTTFKLADGAVTEDKLDDRSVILPKLSGGTVANPAIGRCSQIEVVSNLNPADYVIISGDNGTSIQSFQFTAGTDFAIGATGADTLDNLVAAINALLPGHVVAKSDGAGYAILSPIVPGYPIPDYPSSTDSIYAIVATNSTGGRFLSSYTSDVVYGVPPSWVRSVTALYPIQIVATTQDTARGFIAVKPDPNQLFAGAPLTPFLFCRDAAGASKACGATVSYDVLLQAWVITNTGINDFAATDVLLLLGLVPFPT